VFHASTLSIAPLAAFAGHVELVKRSTVDRGLEVLMFLHLQIKI